MLGVLAFTVRTISNFKFRHTFPYFQPYTLQFNDQPPQLCTESLLSPAFFILVSNLQSGTASP
jgi:hypothetical protein